MAEVRLSVDAFVQEAERLVRTAESRGVPLRMCGSVGIYHAVHHDPTASRLYAFRNGVESPRIAFKDLDLAAREKHASAVYRLFVKELGFREDRETNALFGSFRNIYFHPDFQIDVFYDTLRFNHAIPIKDRLLPGVTLPLEDLFLGKVQIHAPLRKDLIDLASFAAAIPASKLDGAYLATFFGDDWGLWYDADLNLTAARETISTLPSEFDPSARQLVIGRLVEYQEFLRACPKTRRWEKRRAKGTNLLWYEPVDEVR
ncbi:MAG: hypothetical protein L3J78_00995 [Thermoplasmata archaeon]|nr:hypothetical protein [Thermoplasmata archaeon]